MLSGIRNSVPVTNMNKMIQFENHPEIGEFIFSHLDLSSLLNCQNVCQDWKQVLENPYFWLKKLKDVGQPEEIENAWKNLITKSPNFGISKNIFAKCLQCKFKDFTEHLISRKLQNFCTICPLINFIHFHEKFSHFLPDLTA